MKRAIFLLLSAAAVCAANNIPDLEKYESALKSNADDIRSGSEYRQLVIKAKQYDRCIAFFEKLVADNPKAANAFLNYGFAYVDKIPDAGSITQVILANTALSHFSKSIEIKPSWIALYTRGNSYLYWPRIFDRARYGVADLEKAMEIQRSEGAVKPYYVRAYISLGDGYWKMDNLDKARSVWQEGAKLFPNDTRLKDRLARQGDELAKYIDDVLDPNKRVDTNLHEIWESK
jgi:tetratricopeptide (TPR) repeat protein